jgi:predicted transposase YbfD/YdcC
MEQEINARLSEYFGGLADPRRDHTRRHLLLDIIVIGICAVLSGADDFEAVAAFGVAKEGWLRRFLALPNGIPSHDTFWRVFRALDPVQFERCFRTWMAAAIELHPGEVIAIDGKTLRRSYENCPKQGALQLVSAWATENNVVLGQLRIAEKDNEIVAVPELLEQLDVAGCLVTTDAMSCQVKTAQRILDRQGDYLLALKENQPALYSDVSMLFADLESSGYRAYAFSHDQSVDSGHGRIEIRRIWVIDDPQVLEMLPNGERWPQLRSVIRIKSERTITAGPLEKRGQHSTYDRYYISSATASAAFFNAAVRRHWQIENAAHWVLDVAFREDLSRLRRDNGAENFATLRRIALSLLKQDKSSKLGIKNKRLKATWDHNYFLHLLSMMMN